MLGKSKGWHDVFNMSLSLEMKRFEGRKQAFQKVASHKKKMKFANFKNQWGYAIQWDMLRVNNYEHFHCSSSLKKCKQKFQIVFSFEENK